MQNMHNFKYQ